MDPSLTRKQLNISVGRVAIWTATAILVAGLLFAVYSLRDLILMFFVAIVVAAALRPMVLYLQRYRIPKAAAVGLIYIGFLALLIAGAALILPSLVEQVMAFVDQAPARYREILALLHSSNSVILRTLGGSLPDVQNLAQVGVLLGGVMNGEALINTANNLLSMFTAALTVLAVAFYWTMDQPRMERLWLSFAPPSNRPRLLAAWRDAEIKMGSYLRGSAILGVIIAVVTGAGYAVMGLPFALALGILAGIGEFIPVIGFLVGFIPAVLIGLTVSPQLAILVVIWNFIVQGVENQTLVPRIMSDSVGVSPLVVIFALLAFTALFGAVGAFLAIPLAAIIQIILDYFLMRGEDIAEDVIPEAAPLAAARNRIRALRTNLRERLRQRDEYLDVDAGLDAVDQRIEAIVLQVDEAIAEASEHPDEVEVSVIQKIEAALNQVDALIAEVHDTASPIGVTPEIAEANPEVGQELDEVIQEARQTLTSAASEVQGVVHENGTEEAKVEADRLEGEGRLDPRPLPRPSRQVAGAQAKL